MKQKFIILIVSLLFAGTLSAQSHMVTYKLSLEGCNQYDKFELFRGLMFEGDSFIFEDFAMPETEAELQFFYNLLIGSKFGIPNGSLNEDIVLDITLEGLCDLDVNNLSNDREILDLLTFNIDVTGSESGLHSSDNYYYFENSSELYLKIKLQKIVPFLSYLSYSINDLTPFYLNSNLEPDYYGIRKVIDDEYCTIYAAHFSTISMGIKTGITYVNSSSVLSSEFQLTQN